MAEKKIKNYFETILEIKKDISIIIFLFVIGLFLMFGWMIMFDLIKPSIIIDPIMNTIMNPEYFAAFFTLFGAIVGGSFTLLGSVLVNNRNIKMQTQLKRSNEIYKPLYDELRKTQYINISKSYPYSIHMDEKGVLYEEYPKYIEWEKISSDNRTFEVPLCIKGAYADLTLKIIAYKEKFKLAEISIYDKVFMILDIDKKEEIDKSKLSIEGRTKTELLEIILTGYKSAFQDKFLSIYEDNKIQDFESDKEKIILAFKAYEACLELKEVIEIKRIYKEWLDIEKETIELLESLIVHIKNKYDKNARSLFYV